MREIKFRAWDLDEKKMLATPFILFSMGGYGVQSGIGSEVYSSNELEVMQFTGFKDKNGKEIYESDIIGYKNGYKHIVKWTSGECGRTGPWAGWLLNDDFKDDGEVIGNIYENQGILK